MTDRANAVEHKIRVLIADDDVFIREGLVQLLAEDSSVEVIGFAANGEEAIAQAAHLTLDVVVMDLSMPAVDGVAAIDRILSEGKNIAIVALSTCTYIDRAREVIDAGAMGYVVKAGAQRYLTAAIHAVAGGSVFFSPGISGKLLESLRRNKS